MDKKQPEAQQATCTNSDSWNCKYCNKTKTCAALAAGQATAAQAAVPADLITLRKPTTSAELLWLLKLAHLVISDVDKTLEETFSPAQPAAQQAGEPAGTVGYTVHGTQYVNWRTKPPAHGTPLYTTPQPTQARAGAVPLDEARRMFDAGWKAAALFCDREDVVADGIIGFGACPQFEAAFSAAQGIKGGQP